MAPALSIAPREPHIRDSNIVVETEKLLSQRRRALVSVDNIAVHMDDDDVGLQSQPSLAKDSQEMEQILVDLGNADLEQQGDLFQAIETLDTGGDTLSAGDALSTDDPEAIFPLSGFEMSETGDSESDAMEDKIKTVLIKQEQRCLMLQRRLRILQARAIGKKVSEEAAQTFEKCTRGAQRDGGGRPVGLKTFLKTVETTAAIQASAASRTVVGPKYYNPGTSKGDASKSASMGIPSGTLTGLEDTVDALRSHLSMVNHELDSDATLSSSGAESNDEAVTYNNPYQQQKPIVRRALWSWHRRRASYVHRWFWSEAQVQELDYKIRQHNELHDQIRAAKGRVEFEGEPVAYEGSLPGSEPPDDHPSRETCARIRPLRRETFKKRKLLQMHNLHMATHKAARPSDIRCSCTAGAESCAVCTGRAEPTQPAAPAATAPPALRRAAVDPGYHPVLSDIRDVSPSIHMSALTSRAWFRPRVSRAYRGAHHSASSARLQQQQQQQQQSQVQQHHTTSKPVRKHPTRLKRGRPPLTKKIRERERDEETSTSGHERSRGRSSTESRSWRRQSYDIDNIVIPQSVAANTRPQILTYKEIITPKWRVLEIPDTPLNNGVMKTNRMSMESEDEDVSDAAVSARHSRAEGRERAKYVRKQRARRDQHQHQHHAEQHHNHHDDPPAPPPPPPPQPQPQPPRQHTPPQYETVRPYSPRQFPLGEDTYAYMLAAMPDGFHAGIDSPDAEPPPDAEPAPDHALVPDTDSSSSSSLSAADLNPFEGDDPDDAEWDPHAERADRRKSSFR